MKESIIFNDIFSDISNIRYINIKNLDNDKTISNTFNNKIDLFYVCESLTIIDNISAYNCSEYNMTIKQYDEILPTIIPTTILTTILTSMIP